VARLSELQAKLYAQGQWALLLIFQAMDAAGKDGTIKHVMSGVNPQGCEVFSFKAPSAEELAHDFLWRTNCRLPQRGRIGIFNRSYYEEVLVVRVHPELLAHQKLPPSLVTKDIWRERFEDINALERYLTRNGVIVRKFFLHLSKQEQRERLLGRLEQPDKHWKFSLDDLHERQKWAAYADAYQDMIRHTATDYAPWYVIPADHKWFARFVVAEVIVEALDSLELSYPTVNAAKRKELAAVRTALLTNKA
jgi:PPK2 family polyphosphate:nucleotide phosphotransferase